MKFLYEYRTPDNAVHSGVVSASTRDNAYAALKREGIRPSRLTEAPGFANRLFGKGKRWSAIVVLCAVCLVLGAVAVRFSRSARDSRTRLREAQIIEREARFLDDRTRHQVIGDAALIQKGILDGWSDVFPEEGERFLAGFAVPGVPVSVLNTSEGEIRAALGRHIFPAADDTLESRQIKAMVEGMKDELREFLADGGSIVEYGRCLVSRQEEEIAHYGRAKAEIDTLAKSVKSAKDSQRLRARWEELNAGLRKLGVRLVSLPE